MSKDQSLGGIIFAVCVIIGLLYTAGLFYFGSPFGTTTKPGWSVEFWLIATPVFLAFIAILFIGAWIGWTMATTPPPQPIEDITREIEKETEKQKEK